MRGDDAIADHVTWNPFQRDWHLRVPWRASLAAADAATTPCPFCPGGPEALPVDRPHLVPSKYPFILPSAEGRFEPHRVLLFSQDHGRNIDGLEIDQVADILDILGRETSRLLEHGSVRSVYAFQASGTLFGGSVAHPHLQILAFPFVPTKLVPDVTDGCPLCTDFETTQCLIDQTDDVVLAVPPWSRMPYEMVISPRDHVQSLLDCDTHQVAQLLSLAVKASAGLVTGEETPYILSLMTAPKTSVGQPDNALNPAHHIRIELLPFRSDSGALRRIVAIEAALGVVLNPLPPKLAAERLRQLVARARTGGAA